MQYLGFIGTIAAGGLLGAVLVSVVTHFLMTHKDPAVIGDGQYGMIFMGTAPLGWLIGSITGVAIVWGSMPHPHFAGLIGVLLVVGGVLTGPWLGFGGLILVSLIWGLFHPSEVRGDRHPNKPTDPPE